MEKKYVLFDETSGEYINYIDGVIRVFDSRMDAEYTAYMYQMETGHKYRIERA